MAPRRTGAGATVLGGLAAAAILMAALLGLPPSTAQQSPGAGASDALGASDRLVGNGGSASTGPGASASRPAAVPPATPTAASSAAVRTPRANPAPTKSTGNPDAPPASAAEFDLEGQVIAIGFPFKPGARYRYRDNFGEPREGDAEAYNHARVRRGDRLLRAHDGIDFYAATGTPVLAPFDGVVVDPSQRWQPWISERYGLTAAILSQEPQSEGYTALLTHLDAVYVEVGQEVHRGEVVGTVGATGNAEGGRAHLHFELRAPFPLSWEQVGEDRLIDAFNPFPSLMAADPARSN